MVDNYLRLPAFASCTLDFGISSAASPCNVPLSSVRQSTKPFTPLPPCVPRVAIHHDFLCYLWTEQGGVDISTRRNESSPLSCSTKYSIQSWLGLPCVPCAEDRFAYVYVATQCKVEYLRFLLHEECSSSFLVDDSVERVAVALLTLHQLAKISRQAVHCQPWMT